MTKVKIGGSVMANPRRKIRVADNVGGVPVDGGKADGGLGSDILRLANSRCREHRSEDGIARSEYSQTSFAFKQLPGDLGTRRTLYFESNPKHERGPPRRIRETWNSLFFGALVLACASG